MSTTISRGYEFISDAPPQVVAPSVGPILDALSAKELMEPVAIRVVEGFPIETIRSGVYAGGFRRGLRTKTKVVAGLLYVWVVEKIPSPAKRERGISARDAAVINALDDGETMRAIAALHGISYQRVQQIAVRSAVRGYAPANRAKALDEIAAPYLAAVSDEPRCALCHADLVGNNLFCTPCRARIVAIRRVASRLRDYRRSGRREGLRQAMSIARTLGIGPECMEIT